MLRGCMPVVISVAVIAFATAALGEESMFSRADDTVPVQMVSFVTRVVDQGCGLGSYKK